MLFRSTKVEGEKKSIDLIDERALNRAEMWSRQSHFSMRHSVALAWCWAQTRGLVGTVEGFEIFLSLNILLNSNGRENWHFSSLFDYLLPSVSRDNYGLKTQTKGLVVSGF